MTKVQCDTKSECGSPTCEHHRQHDQWVPAFCGEVHYCGTVRYRVRCNPVEEPAKLCPQCGADLAVWKELFGREHECFAPATDLTSPLRPPRGPALYRCTKAATCGIEECTAAEKHTHYVPIIHGPRECGWLREDVECEKVGGPAPLKGVYFSGKVIDVLSRLQGMDLVEWDKLWAMVTGKAEPTPEERMKADAEAIMADADGVPEMTPGLWKSTVETIVLSAITRVDEHGQERKLSAGQAATQILELPPVGHAPSETLPIGGSDENDRQFGPSGRTSEK